MSFPLCRTYHSDPLLIRNDIVTQRSSDEVPPSIASNPANQNYNIGPISKKADFPTPARMGRQSSVQNQTF